MLRNKLRAIKMILFGKTYLVTDGGQVTSKGGPGILVMGGLVALYSCYVQAGEMLDKKEFKRLCTETWKEIERLASGDE